ncbi:peptidoglycan D,D-transpeptidase FtsI family protein [Cellulomonas shaoxiangyii]|uniref:peptidoglycan D,D-transpeptidase FtsI family protein n=2 Tax=Cellulomonas shaoxiangyii TaxID=2566013 RepID=UPI001FC9B640|nr:penicillin-binding protein 2 [Cellulomonas shaoxiangyii]
MSERTGTTPRRGPVQDPNGRRAAAVPPRVPRGSVPAGGTASARATAPRGSAAPRATAARGSAAPRATAARGSAAPRATAARGSAARGAATPATTRGPVPRTPARATSTRPPATVSGLRLPPAEPVQPASRGRVLALVMTFVLLLVLFAGRLVYVQVLKGPEIAEQARAARMASYQVLGARGEITDADGVVLATSVERYTISVNQPKIAEYVARGSDGLDGPAGVAARLAPLLGGNAAELGGTLVGDRPYVVLQKNVLPDVAREIRALRIDGVNVEKVADRVYPKGAVAGNMIGFVNSSGTGLQGLELTLDERLRGVPGHESYERGRGGQPIPGGVSEGTPAREGDSVQLTIKSDLQYKAQAELEAQVAATGATGGALVVMRPNGEVLALADSGSIDPNDPGERAADALSPALTQVFEPGSTSKVVTMAAALEEGLVAPTDQFEVADRWRTPHGETIKDSHDHAVQRLTSTGIFAESSNVGTILIGQRLTKEQRHRYMTAFGFGSRTGIELPGESAGLLRAPEDWQGRDEFAVLFGQALSVNALQAANVFATIANGGVRAEPHLIAGWTRADGTYVPEAQPEGTRVVSPETAATVLSMMESTVAAGTGSSGAIAGYRVGGKTGTAQKFNPSGYTSSFIGVAPADDPQVVTAVILHDPKTSIYGGTVAAPLFSSITQYALQQLGVAPSGAPATLHPTTW